MKVGEHVGVVGFARDRLVSVAGQDCVARSQESPPASKHAGAPTATFICLSSSRMSKLKKKKKKLGSTELEASGGDTEPNRRQWLESS